MGAHGAGEYPPHPVALLYYEGWWDLAASPSVAVVDDLLTTGAHFRAVATVLSARFPDIDVVGLFIARRVPETTAPEAVGG